MIKNINQAVSVKKANLFYDENKEEYFLMHYDTEILRIYFDEIINKYVVVKALRCSNSSTRAIIQACNWLDVDYCDIVKPKMTRYTDFYKYPTGN